MSFASDLNFGRFYELEFLKHLQYDTVEQSPDTKKFSDWDLKVIKDGKVTTYEVKCDRYALMTNNICVEYQNRYGEKSGLSASKADFWIFMLLDPISGYHIYKVPRRELKAMVNNQEFHKQICIKDSKNKCVLFHLNKFKKYLYKKVNSNNEFL